MDTQRALKPVSETNASSAGIAMMYLAGTDYIPGTAMAAPPRSMFVHALKPDSGKIVLRADEKVDVGTVFHAKMFGPDAPHRRPLTLEALD